MKHIEYCFVTSPTYFNTYLLQYLLYSIITSVEPLVSLQVRAFRPTATDLGRLRPHELREMADIDKPHQIFPVITEELDLVVPVVYHYSPVRLCRSQILS